MKTGTIFVLVVFIFMGLEVAWAQVSLVKGQQRPGFCPELPEGIMGICAEMCSGDDSCPEGMKCCSNGCGHVCKAAVFRKGGSRGPRKPGLNSY